MTTAASAPAAAIAAVIWMVARVDSHPDPASTNLSVKRKGTNFSQVFLGIPSISYKEFSFVFYLLFFFVSPPACCLTARIISTRSSGVR
jgi:hypothetical protein